MDSKDADRCRCWTHHPHTRDIKQQDETWIKDAQEVYRLDCQAMDEIWESACGSDWEPNDDFDKERRMPFRFPKDKPRQQPDTPQHTANSPYKYQRMGRPSPRHGSPSKHRRKISQ